MKRLLLLSLLTGTALVSSAQTAPESVQIRRYQIELPAKPYRLFKGDFDLYKGVYDLSNGDTLALRQQGRRIYGSVGNQPEKEMVAAKYNQFVALDRKLQVTVEHDFFGETSGEVLMEVPRSMYGQANAGGEVVRMAIR